jgi:hypothetical protein
MRHKATRSNLLLVVLLLVGGWLGNYVGTLIARSLPLLAKNFSFGISPFTINIDFLQLTFGAMAHINPIGLLGIIIAIVVWMRT